MKKKKKKKNKTKILRTLALVLALVFLTGCGTLSRYTTPKETVTARPTASVTVPEGYTVYQIALLLEEKGVCTSADFIAAVNNPPADNAFAMAITNAEQRPFVLEGYLFPDTYEFYTNESAPRVLGKFLGNMASKLTQDDYTRAAELGYTMDEIITIASLIQEEAGFKNEDPKVSAVIHNRLGSDKHPRLQLNVTFDYLDLSVEPIMPDARDKYDALYNTYVRKGLPVGPISNPGKTSIDAALYPATPAETDDEVYYYFFTYAGWNYYYSTSFEEHAKEYEIRRKWDTPTG